VESYRIWYTQKEYKFFPSSLEKSIFKNPYRFYDHRIKKIARSFLDKPQEFQDPVTNKWVPLKLTLFQNLCELVFITCTRKQLILSRGKDHFNPGKENKLKINWSRTS